MPTNTITIKLTFDYDLNSSLQIGDTVWIVKTSSYGSHDTGSTNDNSFLILGVVEDINRKQSTIDVEFSSFDLPEDLGLDLQNSFFMFSKNKAVNSAGLKGYYAELEFVNNSNKKIELFSVGSEVVQSSK